MEAKPRRFRQQVWNRFVHEWQDYHFSRGVDSLHEAKTWWVVSPDTRRIIDTEDGQIVFQPRD